MLDRRILILLIVLLGILPASTFADSPPSAVAENQIKIDGDGGDWSSIDAFKSSFGGSKKGSDTVDVKSLHMAFTKTDFYFKAELDPSPDGFGGNGEVSIMQVIFDADVNDSTGNRSAKIYKVIPKGFETRFELVIKNKKIIGRLYSHENDFKNKVKEWKAGSANLAVNGGTVEFKVPFDLVKFIPASGFTNLRLYLCEFANMAEQLGYNKISLKLDFGSIDKLKAVDPGSSNSDVDSKSEGGFSIASLTILALWIVSILCGFAIAPKAGFSNGIAAINFIPVVGQLIFLFILAFGQWPLHKDYQKIENRLREFDEEI